MHISQTKNNAGFTIVEVAIALIIGGAMLAMVGGSAAAFIKKNRVETTTQNIKIIKDALRSYMIVNGALPCPASPTAAPGDVEFGRAADCSTFTPAPGRGGRSVIIGSVPTRTLNLPDNLMLDAWTSRLTYAVTEVMTDVATFDPTEGAIDVLDSAGNSMLTPVGSGHFIIVSHGSDQAGAANLNGNVGSGCPTGGGAPLDAENCDGDADFRSTILNSFAGGAAHYDDYVAYYAGTSSAQDGTPSGAVVAFNSAGCPDGWAPVTEARGRMVVGATAPGVDFNDTYNGEGRPTWSYNQSYPLGSTGGYGTWQADVNEMPSHTHSLNYTTIASTLPAGSTHTVLIEGGVGPTSGAGATQPQKNMPPYLALLYCEKI